MKKILIGVAVIIVLIGGTLYYFNSRNRTLSPLGSAELTNKGLTVTVSYSRPSVRGRVIFGTEADSALLKFGKYWRMGANEPTKITFNADVKFNGNPISAGEYQIYAYPGADTFEIVVNKEIPFWGAGEPDQEGVVLRTTIPVSNAALPIEQFTIDLLPSGNGMTMVVKWDRMVLGIPIEIQ